MSTVYTVNVGANTNPDFLGLSGPIYPNGTFDYIPIPSRSKTRTTYRSIGLESAFRRMGISDKLDDGVHHCPEFETFTYGTYPTTRDNRNVSRLQDVRRRDWIFFVASLQRTRHEQMGSVFQDWIAEKRGMYFIGFFEITSVLKPETFDKRKNLEPFKGSPHFEWLRHIPEDQSYIFKGSRHSMLFPVAVPIRSDDIENLFQVERKPANLHETSYVNSHTRPAREVLDVNHLRKMVKQYVPFFSFV